MLVVMALGGDRPPNLAEAARAVAAIAVENTVVVTCGDGPRARHLARQVDSHHPDSRAAAGEAPRVLASILETEMPSRKIATVVTDVEVRLVPVGPHYVDTPLGLGSVTFFGWMAISEASGFRRVIPTPEPQGIAQLGTIRTRIQAGALLICSFGAGITTTESSEFGLRAGEVQIDEDLAAALLAEQIGADLLMLLGRIDVPRADVNWPRGPAQALGASTNETLRRISLGPGLFGPQAEAACRFVESTGKRAAIGAIAHAPAILRGDRGIQIATTSSPAATVAGDGPATVLFVDDNDVATRLCRRVLEKAGYNVLTASDGLGAVWLASANSPDLIVLDDAMPGMTSLTAMRLIKQHTPGTPIVITSVDPSAMNRDRFLAAGANQVMSIPLRLSDLIAVAANFTANHSQQVTTTHSHVVSVSTPSEDRPAVATGATLEQDSKRERGNPQKATGD